MREKYEKSSYNTDVPAALPRQLTVSQRVTARHPVTRQLHDGDVLTIAPDCYRSAPTYGLLPCLLWPACMLCFLCIVVDPYCAASPIC